VGIVCQGLTDINRFVTPPFLVNTWHGTPIKKVLMDDKGWQVNYAKIKNRKLLPFFNNLTRYKLVTAESEIEAEILKRSFSSAVVEVTGQPRNDVLVKRKTSGEPAQGQEGSYAPKRILYLPTHRMYGKSRTFSQLAVEFASLDPVLRHLNALLLIKLHYYHQDEAKELAQKLSGLKNVRVLLDEELVVMCIHCLPVATYSLRIILACMWTFCLQRGLSSSTVLICKPIWQLTEGSTSITTKSLLDQSV